jgi:altronate dehydratase
MSLLGISKLPTAENSAIQLHPRDNVAIARVPLSIGAALSVGGQSIRTRSAIPAGHKVAIKSVAEGENLVRYGQLIGRASRAIEPGDHVHTHNVAFEELTFNYEFPTGDIALPTAPADVPAFM